MPISRRWLMVAVTGFLAHPAASQTSTGSSPARLTLVVFEDRRPSDALTLQLAMLASPKVGRLGFEVVEAVGNEPIRVNREPQSEPTAATLRRDYRVGEGFAIRVVDDDGVVLLATRQPVTVDDLEALVASIAKP